MLTVNKALLTVTASNVTRAYGQTNPSLPFSVTGFVYGETTNVLSGQPSTSTTATTNSVPGTYPITVSGGTATNYNFTNIPGTLTVSAAILNSNSITLTPPASLIYDGSAKAYTASAPGVSGFRITYVGRNTTSYVQTTTAPTNAGEYAVTATDTDPNYDGNKSLDFVISKANQTITFNSIPVKYLDEGSFILNATASSGLAVSYESSNTNVAAISGSTVTLKSAGTTTITASQAGNINWNTATNVAQTLTVQARDTDGDGVTDVMELTDGTQTNNASSFNPLSKGLVAYYPFNGNANDASGCGNHAIPQGTIQFITNGLSGGAFRTIGDGSQYYAGGGHAMLPNFTTNLNSGLTLSLWVRDEIKGPAPAADIEQYISFGTADLPVLAVCPWCTYIHLIA
jgi:hypothetical protein